MVYLKGMSFFLILLIYLAFIGLGLPDSLFGTAWPAVYAEFSLPFSFGTIVSVIVTCGTILSSLFSARVIHRFGTNKVVAFSTLLTALSIVGYAVSPNIWVMLLFAVPLGFGAGSIDVALNNYVALHYSASVMNYLHCFYGVGVSISPYVLSLVIGGEGGWRKGYFIVAGIQAFITVLLFLSLPIWKKVHPEDQSAGNEKAKVLSFRQTLAIPGVRFFCALFFIFCAIECVCGGWGSTFLVEYRGLTADQAAEVVLFFFIGMAVSRFLSGVLAKKVKSRQIIAAGISVLGIGMILLFIPGPQFLYTAAFFLVGLGNGPLFPNFTHIAPETFGKDVSESVISMQMTFAYVGILLGPLLCGLLAQAFTMLVFPVFLTALFAAMLFLIWRMKR